MLRYLAWIGKLVGTLWVGPGSVVLGDSLFRSDPAHATTARWVARAAALAPLVIVLLMFVGLPWPFLAIVAAILLLPLIVTGLRAAWRRR